MLSVVNAFDICGILYADVEIQWQDHDVLSVNPIVKESFGVVGRTQYEVGNIFNRHSFTLLSLH